MKAKDFGAPEEFWNENVVLCNRCGEPIAFAKDETGKWIVMRPDFKGRHQCKIIKEVKNGRKSLDSLEKRINGGRS